MNWKNRLTNYNFWISLISAVLLILQALNIEFDIAYVNEISTAVLGLLVVIGIISDPTRTSVKSTDVTPNKQKKDNAIVEQETPKAEEKPAEVEQKSKEEKEIPIVEQTEDNNEFDENHIKDVLNKISSDLQKEMDEAKNLKEEYLKLLNQSKKIEENVVQEQENNSTQDMSTLMF